MQRLHLSHLPLEKILLGAAPQTKKQVSLLSSEEQESLKSSSTLPSQCIISPSLHLKCLFLCLSFNRKKHRKNNAPREKTKKDRDIVFLHHHQPFKLVNQFVCRISTPKMSLKELKNPFETQHLPAPPFYSMPLVCQLSHYPIPPKVPFPVELLIMDNSTIIPYGYIKSSDFNDAMPKNVFVFCLDIFSNQIYNDSHYFLGLLDGLSNTIFVFWNYPGQAYTMFNPGSALLYDNTYLANTLDMIFYELDCKFVINPEMDSMNFVGVGFGGSIVLFYLAQSNGAVSTISSVLLANSYSFVDDSLRETFETLSSTFSKIPNESPELAFDFYNMFTLKDPSNFPDSRLMHEKNPIKLAGRLSLINGAIKSTNVMNHLRFFKSPMVVIHSKSNTLISINQTEALININPEYIRKNKKSSQSVQELIESKEGRLLLLVNGGHDVLLEKEEDFEMIMKEFIRTKRTMPEYEPETLLLREVMRFERDFCYHGPRDLCKIETPMNQNIMKIIKHVGKPLDRVSNYEEELREVEECCANLERLGSASKEDLVEKLNSLVKLAKSLVDIEKGLSRDQVLALKAINGLNMRILEFNLIIDANIEFFKGIQDGLKAAFSAEKEKKQAENDIEKLRDKLREAYQLIYGCLSHKCIIPKNPLGRYLAEMAEYLEISLRSFGDTTERFEPKKIDFYHFTQTEESKEDSKQLESILEKDPHKVGNVFDTEMSEKCD